MGTGSVWRVADLGSLPVQEMRSIARTRAFLPEEESKAMQKPLRRWRRAIGSKGQHRKR